MKAWRDRFEHHLILKMAGDGVSEAARYLSSVFPSATGDFFECTDEEASRALLHRFVAAGAAVRYRAVHDQAVEDIVALDIALKQNDRNWFEILPDDVRAQIHLALYYGHFFCHVFHQDYIVRKGIDTTALEHRLWHLLDERGAEYPAEHNVGHLYRAKPALAEFYRSLDPCNQFNPGIGQTSKYPFWKSESDR
jgi:D-lactate dehydrogenase